MQSAEVRQRSRRLRDGLHAGRTLARAGLLRPHRPDRLIRAARKIARYIIDFVYGEVYAGDALDPKTRALCTVAMLAALGQQLQLGVYVQAARRQGASEEEIREVLRQVAVYAGFPSAWNALATMKTSLGRFDETDREARP